MRCISSRLNVLNACWICLPAKLLTLANLCFQGEELKVKMAVRCISGRAENRKQIGTMACGQGYWVQGGCLLIWTESKRPIPPLLGARHFNHPWKPRFSLGRGGTVLFFFFFGLDCFYMVTFTTPFCLELFSYFFKFKKPQNILIFEKAHSPK